MRVAPIAVAALFFVACRGPLARAPAPARAVAAEVGVGVVPPGERGAVDVEIDAPVLGAPPADADADDDDASMIVPCPATGPEHDAAAKAVDALEARVTSLGDAADPKPVAEEIAGVLDAPCFRLSAGEREGLDFASALSLKTWWNDGGRDWLDSYVSLGARRLVVVPPSIRAALTLENAPKRHALLPLLCPAGGKPGCGRETVGWTRRAEATLARYGGPPDKTEEECGKDAAAAAPSDRYDTFRACIADGAPRHDALPLGRFEAPDDGWLVMQDEAWPCLTVRAYDLASGAAYVAASCKGGAQAPKVGRVHLHEIREAAWMMMIAGASEEGIRTGETAATVPEGVRIARPDGLGSISARSRCGGSSGTLRGWSWMRAGHGSLSGVVSGRLRLPTSSRDADTYAGELLQIAEDGFEEGCAPAAPPAAVDWATPGPVVATYVSAPDLDDARFAGTHAALASAAWKSCPKRP